MATRRRELGYQFMGTWLLERRNTTTILPEMCPLNLRLFEMCLLNNSCCCVRCVAFTFICQNMATALQKMASRSREHGHQITKHGCQVRGAWPLHYRKWPPDQGNMVTRLQNMAAR